MAAPTDLTNLLSLNSFIGERPPFERTYWAVFDQLLAGCYPGDRSPTVAAEKLSGLVQCGVSFVMNLMAPMEKDHRGQPFQPYEATLQALAATEGRTVECVRRPIRDCGVPSVSENDGSLG